jgi:hypothetical protein
VAVALCQVVAAGVTEPPADGFAAVVKLYCVVKLAVQVVSFVGAVIVWLCPPPSLQEAYKYRVPISPVFVWGEATERVWLLPGSQVKVWGAV